MNHTPKISFDGCGLNDANDPYKRRLFTAENRNESRSVGMYIEQACNSHEELVAMVKEFIQDYQEMGMGDKQAACNAQQLLTTIEKGS